VLGLVIAGRPVIRKRAPIAPHYGFRASSISLRCQRDYPAGCTGAFVEAIRRLIHPEPFVGTTMIWVVRWRVINGVTALMFIAAAR